jgi:RimJ/RimL family protein N-acetyltransferase
MRDEAEHKGDSEAVGLGARRCRDAEGVIRRAKPADVDFLVALFAHEEVAPYLAAVRPQDRESVLAEVERSQREPSDFGVFVVEVDGRPVGTMAFEVANRRSRIAHLGGLAIHPDFRGRRLADEAARHLQRHLLLDLGFHRLQMEVYGFNERAMRHAERVGFVREGVRRQAYRRHGGWQDGVLFGLIREDLGLDPGVDLLYEYAARHNQGVRTGDWEPLAECFADDAVLAFEGRPRGQGTPEALAAQLSGRDAIAAAYRDRAPDDEVRVLEADERDGVVAARYAWAKQTDREAGTLTLDRRGNEIVRLVVTFADS